MGKLKAYAVTEELECTGAIYFAQHAIVARRMGAAEYSDGELRGVSCKRAPWADRYAPGPVPKLVMMDNGWWFHCHGCGMEVRDEVYDPETDEPIDLKPVEDGCAIFCSEQCRANLKAEQAEEQRIAACVIADLSDRLLRILPGAVITGRSHVYVPRGPWPRSPGQAIVEFTFPGASHGLGCFRFNKPGEKPYVSVCQGDRAAFYAWQEAGCPPHMMDAREIA